MADRLLKLPSTILIGAFSDVFYQKISKIKSYNEIFIISNKNFKKLFYILFIPFSIILLLLKDGIPILFGEQWSELYLYMYILSLPIFFNLLTAHFSKILIVVNRQEVSFYFHLYKLLSMLLVLSVLVFYQQFNLNALIVLSIHEIVWILIGIVLIKIILKVKELLIWSYVMALILIALEFIIYKEVL